MMATILAGALLPGCYHRTFPCDAEVGVCPRPEPGILVERREISKSLWYEDDRLVVEEEGFLLTVCRGDLDTRAGEEIIFRGDEGFVVLSSAPTDPAIYGFMDIVPIKVRYVDVESDGDVEYLEYERFERVRLLDHSGGTVWEVRPDYDRVPPFWTPPVLWLDTDEDGLLEFFVGTEEGVQHLTADGTLVGTIGDAPYWRIRLGQLDDDEDLELVAAHVHVPSPPPGKHDSLSTWDLDGAPIASFDVTDSDEPRLIGYFALVPAGERGQSDRIWIGDALYDPQGVRVGTIEEWDWNSSPLPIAGTEQAYDACPAHIGTSAEPVSVRFVRDEDPFVVEFAHSFERVEWGDFVQAGGYYNVTRAVLKIYDPSGELVYHEVMATKTGPGSFTVIPSDIEGEEIFLVADGPRVYAFRSTDGLPDGG
jgi:hypothetical protein